MSFLVASTPAKHTFPASWSPGVAGLLALSELAPVTGEFQNPPNWPPRGGAAAGMAAIPGMDGMGRHSGATQGKVRSRSARERAAIMQAMSQSTRKQLHRYHRALKSQGIPNAEINRRMAARRARLAPDLTPPPSLPGAFKATSGQGAYLSPNQLLRPTRNGASIADERQAFSMDGLGQNLGPHGGMSPAAAARLYALQQQAASVAAQYTRPPVSRGGSHQGGAAMYVDPSAAIRSSHVEGQIQLQPICDEHGNCIRYASPAEVEAAIGAKIGGKSALTQGQAQLPGFYHHPKLGPWGVDPTQAYQYWAAQQAAMQAGAFASPMAVFGSPGMAPASPAQPMATGGSTSFAPVPGGSSERF